ncbi:hypothetical protein T8S45_09475 [Blastomonas marina]|uniref:hypothetical protein n=1 Tax=Blastomonas marina TaxID=1867408 RepID=UPI002AC9E70D|nr:hypothetical protein [Blastomonas marina]WPZ03071.1 hypothetical protein T8S45_09475 [Blastomonas marina]
MSELPFKELENLSFLRGLPNPKPQPADKRGYGELASLYTAFSREFAAHLLTKFAARGQTKILDPFGGMGTVGEAGRDLPLEITLNDISPFASLSGLFRTSNHKALRRAIDRVRSINFGRLSGNERKVFLGAIREISGSKEPVISWMNADQGEDHAVSLLSIHILCLIRIETHRGYRGSNPTWTKKASSEAVPSARLEAAKSSVLDKVDAYVTSLPETHFEFRAHHTCGDVAHSQILVDKFDAILTSPPYPNRTDYIRHYLPATELLIGGDDDTERQLREDQIGTPLIRKVLPPVKLPHSATSIIEAIGQHESYASKSYYVKGYQYYFADMDLTLRNFRRLLKSGGSAVIVVQDAYYKDLRIPVADLLIDIAENIGFELKERTDFKVKHALSNLSPLARKSAPKKLVQETCFLLKKGQ